MKLNLGKLFGFLNQNRLIINWICPPKPTKCFANLRSYSSSCGSSTKKIKSKRDKRVGGKCTFSTIFFFIFHFESIGLAAAKIDVRAFNWQIMPALAMDNVCCSITSWRILRVESFILSNSSMQHTPLSAKTRAPVWSTTDLESGSRVIEALKPTADEP